MANRFWVGGTGNWDGTTTTNWSTTSGGAGGASAPTSTDDAFFDANSGGGVVSITSSTATCNNWNSTGFTGSFGGGGGTAGIVGNITVGVGVTGMGFFAMKPATGTTSTLTTNGRTMSAFDVNGAGTVSFLDAVTSNSTINFVTGTLLTNNFAVTCNVFTSSNTNTRTLTLGSSAVTVTGGAGNSVVLNAIGVSLTVTANTAVVTMTGASPGPNTQSSAGSGNMNGASLVLTPTASAQIINNATWANVTYTGPANKTSTFAQNGGQLTVTGTLTINGNSVTNRVLVQSTNVGTARVVSAAAVSISNADFMDITAAGAANWNLSAITGGSGDAGGNSGITFTTAVTRYGVVAGNWSSTATWSTTSGGAGGASVPLPQDTVILDANSAAGTYTRDMPRIGKDLICTGFTRTLTASVAHTLFGSVTLSAGMTFGSGGFSTTLGGRGAHTLTSAGQIYTGGSFLNGPGGSYTLADAFSANAVGSFLTVTAGSFDSASFAISAGTVSSSGTVTRAITLGTSTVSLTSTANATIWNIAATGLTLSAASSTIVISTASASARTFSSTGGALTYGTVTYTVAASTGVLVVTATTSTAIGTLNVSGGARTLSLNTGGLTVTNWNVFGLVGALVTINSTTAGSPSTISKASGYIASDYVSVQDITGTGGATFYMGSRSTSVSGNTGLSFTDAPQRFWVGGTATWDATVGTKWAVVSGGTGGLTVPDSTMDVYFDANSGASTVTSGGVCNCKSIDMLGFTGSTANAANINVSGTVLRLSSVMGTQGWGFTCLTAAGTTVTVTSGGKTMAALTTNGTSTSTLVLADALSVTGILTHSLGTFQTNNFAVTCGTFSSANTNTRILTLGSSSITVTGTASQSWNTSTTTGLTVTANTATVIFTGNISLTAFSSASAFNYNGLSLIFSGPGQPILTASGCTFANVTRTGTATKNDTLTISTAFTVTGTFTVNGNSATNRVIVQSSTVGTARVVTAATVVASNADFMDIAGAGAANWDLSAITGGSGDAGGNSGITFTTGATNYWVGGTGNWSDITHWANSSGGVGGTGRVPLPQGTARFDANSFTAAAQTVTTDMPRAAKDIDWTGATNTPAWTNSIAGGYAIYGSLTMISGMTLVGGTSGPLFNGRGTHTLTSAGKTIQNSINFSSPGATYTMQDAFGTIGSSGITFNAGTFNTGGFTLTTPIFSSGGGGTRTVSLSTSTVNLTATSGTPWNVTAAGLTLSVASSTITFSVASASTRSFTSTGGAQTYGTLTYTVAASTGRLAMSTSTGTSFTAINVSGGVRELNFTSGTSTTVTSWNVFGTSGALVLVTASTPGTQATLVKSDGVAVSSNYVNVQDIAASPANTWYAAPGSVNSGNNSGWIFNQAYSVSTADSAPATDAATGRLRGPRSMADTAPATDVVARSAFHSSRATADTAHATDAVTSRLRAVLALTEGMSLSDAVTFIFAVSLRLKDHRSGSWQPTSRLKWYDTSTHTWRVMRIKRNITSTGAWVPAQMESP